MGQGETVEKSLGTVNSDVNKEIEITTKNVTSLNIDNSIGRGMQMYNEEVDIDDIPGARGTTSMFNEYNVFSLARVSKASIAGVYDVNKHYDATREHKVSEGNALSGNVPFTQMPLQMVSDLYSSSYNKNSSLYKAPTAGRIIEESNKGTHFGLTQAPYSWSDFLYCKYYGEIPNNHLITLRRYAFPVFDNLSTVPVDEPDATTPLPVSQAVSWLGEETGNKMNDILKFTFGYLWKEIEPIVQDVEGNEIGFGSGIESLLQGYLSDAGALRQATSEGSTDKWWSGIGAKENNYRKKMWSDEGPYWNQVYGPVNVIHKTYMRDRGLNFTNDITLKFQYSLKSIHGVNPRVAMLDLITNFLSLTYSSAKFWGGAIRYFPDYSDAAPFFGGPEALAAFMSGDMTKYFEITWGAMADIGSALQISLSSFYDLSGGMMDTVKSLVTGTGNMITSAGKKLLEGFVMKLARQSRPEYLSVRSMLTGHPIGEWHLTVGNPMNPIAVIGDLIVETTDMEFNETLGADDFPTEVTFTVKLKHGKARDKGGIESIFNYGQGQMTHSPLINLPSEKNTYGNALSTAGVANLEQTTAGEGSYLVSGEGGTVNLSNPDGALVERENAGTTSDNSNRIKQRITTEWGPIFGNSTMYKKMIKNKQIDL